ncbi:MAG: crossover junction endodeoxyribonuclease RuvC [Myxococcales bacterium]|nr:crossover junction endodeoxyribonuclease RuvC [Myxococcales bacterium]
MRILGIDPGSHVCGYGVIDVVAAGLTYVECGVLTARADDPAEARLGEIARGLGEVLDELAPTTVAVEDVFARINLRSALALAQARGMALAVVGLRGLVVASYPAPQVKKMITGRGRAGKEQVAHMVAALVGLRVPPRADAADALALAIAHARTVAAAAAAPRIVPATRAAGGAP